MTTAAFNASLALNGGIGNVVAFRLIGGELIYLAPSDTKDKSEASARRYPIRVATDVIYIKRKVSSPMGPQIDVVTMVEIAMIGSINYFWDEDDLTQAGIFETP